MRQSVCVTVLVNRIYTKRFVLWIQNQHIFVIICMLLSPLLSMLCYLYHILFFGSNNIYYS